MISDERLNNMDPQVALAVMKLEHLHDDLDHWRKQGLSNEAAATMVLASNLNTLTNLIQEHLGVDFVP